MYELWHLGAAYVVGTAVGLLLFRKVIQESLITSTIDILIDQDYLRSWIDSEGVTHLYKWYEEDEAIQEYEENQE